MRRVFLEFANYAFDYDIQNTAAGVSFHDQFYQFICGAIEKEKRRRGKPAIVSWLNSGTEAAALDISSINYPFGVVQPNYSEVKLNFFSNLYHNCDHFSTDA